MSMIKHTKSKYKRLQRKDWHDIKHTLTPIKYETSDNGHIKGFYKSEDGTIYTHWLNNDEIKELEELNASTGQDK